MSWPRDLAELEPLTVTVTDLDGDRPRCRVSLVGELDLAGRTPLARVLATCRAPAPGARLEIDLSGLTFLDASGISALIALEQRLHRAGWWVTFTDPSTWVCRVLTIAGRLPASLAVLQGTWSREPAVDGASVQVPTAEIG
jgi:anti-anti-sigma factor